MRIKGLNLEVGLLLFSETPLVVPEPTILLQSLMRVLGSSGIPVESFHSPPLRGVSITTHPLPTLSPLKGEGDKFNFFPFKGEGLNIILSPLTERAFNSHKSLTSHEYKAEC